MDPASVTLTANGTEQPVILIFGRGTKLPPGTTIGDAAPDKGTAPLGTAPLGAGLAGAALVLLLGIPARRRGWRAMARVIAPVLLLMAALLGLSACSTNSAKVTAGNYSFTVTGVSAEDSSVRATATITVRVL